MESKTRYSESNWNTNPSQSTFKKTTAKDLRLYYELHPNISIPEAPATTVMAKEPRGITRNSQRESLVNYAKNQRVHTNDRGLVNNPHKTARPNWAQHFGTDVPRISLKNDDPRHMGNDATDYHVETKYLLSRTAYIKAGHFQNYAKNHRIGTSDNLSTPRVDTPRVDATFGSPSFPYAACESTCSFQYQEEQIQSIRGYHRAFRR